MLKVAVELVNIDEVLAENNVKKTVDALALVAQPIKKSLVIEPHDDVRGVWASFTVKEPEDYSPMYDKALVAAIKSVVLVQEYVGKNANVHVTVSNDKGDK